LLNQRIPVIRNQTLIGLSVWAFGLFMAWELAGKILVNDMSSIAFVALACVALVVAIKILRDWRLGFYSFLIWVLFEDLVRKFLGNNMAIYFAKDVLVGLTYVALFVDIRRGRAATFRPPFRVFFFLFLWLGIVQIFNSNSPNILYGLMGAKIYFFYVPLMFVSYALIRNDEDLRKFLVVNAVLAAVISALGITQAILGNSFLNPTTLAPDLRELGSLDRVTPLTGQILSLPSAVFVSSGRFAYYLIVAVIVVMGSAGYLLLYTKRSRKVVFVAFALVLGATLFSGSRGAVVYVFASVLVLAVGLLWGAPWRWRQAHRMVKAVRRAFIIGSLALAAILLLFPEQAGTRLAFYTETLSPSSSAYEGHNRAWDYPLLNLELAFTNKNWLLGNGIGTASLGGQYVARFTGSPPLNIWVEEGYGLLIIEMGIVAPFLWLLWTGALVITGWRALRPLRQTRFFPIGFAILWYVFLLLYPLTFGGLVPYQNYVTNAYLWLLVGILFRLPSLLVQQPDSAAAGSSERASIGGLQF
jgi:hypothetical protein